MRTTNKRKAFTIVEVVIVIIIIGLLAAMAIPAFHKVRVNSLAKAVASGQTISEKDADYLRKYSSDIPREFLDKIDVERGTQKSVIYVAPQTIKFDQTIILNGKTYGLVPLN
jgi:prepilin-type N-terminal cleavage/methylation domain-containing protein